MPESSPVVLAGPAVWLVREGYVVPEDIEDVDEPCGSWRRCCPDCADIDDCAYCGHPRASHPTDGDSIVAVIEVPTAVDLTAAAATAPAPVRTPPPAGAGTLSLRSNASDPADHRAQGRRHPALRALYGGEIMSLETVAERLRQSSTWLTLGDGRCRDNAADIAELRALGYVVEIEHRHPVRQVTTAEGWANVRVVWGPWKFDPGGRTIVRIYNRLRSHQIAPLEAKAASLLATGEARCRKTDQYVKRIGVRLALARAVAQLCGGKP